MFIEASRRTVTDDGAQPAKGGGTQRASYPDNSPIDHIARCRLRQASTEVALAPPIFLDIHQHSAMFPAWIAARYRQHHALPGQDYHS